jgi:hypothetical protein
MRSKIGILILSVVAAGLLSAVVITAQGPLPQTPQGALGSTFTYQGQLKKNNSLVNDFCNLTFSLWDAESGGNQVGSNQLVSGLTIANGLITTQLNGINEFGANAFNGEARWLQIDTQCASDGGGVVTLSRQPITAAPYSLFALSAGVATTATTALTATFALSANQTVVQARINGSCSIGSSVRAVKVDGSVTCESPSTLYYPPLKPQSLNLTDVSPSLKGYIGGFTDGRYGYFVPSGYPTRQGMLARVDLTNFTVSGVTVLDLTTIDAELLGFAGGFSDGRYGYLVPNGIGVVSYGKIARVDLQSFITTSVTVLDLSLVDSQLKGFEGGFTDGRYGYFVPQEFDGANYHGKVARVDLNNFTTGGVTVLDLTLVDTNLRNFIGGFTDGRYGYIVPHNNPTCSGKIARIDLQNFATGGVSVLDLATVDSSLKCFAGGFSDGRYGYLVPFAQPAQFGKVARVDLQNFTSSGVSVLDLTTVNPALKGFFGGFTDGRYAYFVPGDGNSVMARIDLRNFSPSGVTSIDFAASDPNLKGYRGAFSDGRHAYFVPFHNGVSDHGDIARIQLFFGDASP